MILKYSRPKILCITPIEHIEGLPVKLGKLGYLKILPDPTADEVKNHSSDYDIIFTNPNKSKVYLDENSLGSKPNISIICTASTGRTHIDLNWASKQGIKIISLTKEYSVLSKISSTAELAFTHMLVSLRLFKEASDSVKNNRWDYEPYIGRQLSCLNVGVLGYGRLGKMFCKYCAAFGANVLVYDPYVKVPKQFKQIYNICEFLKKLDVLSIHVHINDETNEMINRDWFSHMKKDILIVNTSRGEIFNEPDLIKFMDTNCNVKLCTDVLKQEQLGLENNLLFKYSKGNSNIMLTPHIGGMTKDAQMIAYNHAVKMLENEIKKNKNIS